MFYKLIYFTGCPNYPLAMELVQAVGIECKVICQDELAGDDPDRDYSSPTLICGEEIIFGTIAIGGGCSAALPSKEELYKIIS